MNVLVVEDEILIRNSLIASLNQHGFVEVFEAENGVQALDVMQQHRIDLLISDIRMPMMDGIELLNCVRKQFGNVIFIVLSGYDLFAYAQNAIRLGAFAYLLKPLNQADLQSVLAQAIEEIINKRELQGHELQINIKLKQGTMALRKHFFLELVNGRLHGENYIRKRLEQYDLSFIGKYYCVLIVGIDNFHAATLNMSVQDKDLVKYGLENIGQELLTGGGCIAYPFPEDEGVGFVINFEQYESSFDLIGLTALCKKIQDAAETYLKFTLTAGIGSLETSLSTLHQSYFAAKKAFAQKMIYGNNKVYQYRHADKKNPDRPFPDLKTEQELLVYFETNNQAEALNFISRQYSKYFSDFTFDMDDIKQTNYQLLLLIHQILRQLQLDPESILGEEFYLYTQVNGLKDLDSIIRWFHGNITKCFDALHEMSLKSTRKLMDKARDYITANFHKELSLDLVAEHLHIRPEYLSREFKKEIGENFIDFLLRIRIAKAKEYLQQGSYKTYEIANLVGFNDEKYFARVFKKKIGISPSGYKFRKT